MKGLAVTLDAVVAITFFLLVLAVITAQAYQPRAPGSIYLKQVTLDVLTVLEKTGRIDMALYGNLSAMQEVVEATPELACMRISVINSTGDVVVSSLKGGCTESAGLDMQVASRPAIYLDGKYVVRAESWFRKEPD